MKDFIQKLNSIDIKDLKKIDTGVIKDLAFSKPNILINIILIVLTLFVIISKVKEFRTIKRSTHFELIDLEKKQGIVQAQYDAEKNYRLVADAFPEAIPNSQLISKLSEFADKHDIRILSFSPAREQIRDNIIITNIAIRVRSDFFNNLTQFTHDIETSSYSLRMLKWTSQSSTQIRRERDLDIKIDSSPIEAQIEIVSIRLKDEI